MGKYSEIVRGKVTRIFKNWAREDSNGEVRLSIRWDHCTGRGMRWESRPRRDHQCHRLHVERVQPADYEFRGVV